MKKKTHNPPLLPPRTLAKAITTDTLTAPAMNCA